MDSFNSKKWIDDRDTVQIQDLCSDTILYHQLFQKLKLIGNDKFNYLANTLTHLLEKRQR
jgi:hypothetical protein